MLNSALKCLLEGNEKGKRHVISLYLWNDGHDEKLISYTLKVY